MIAKEWRQRMLSSTRGRVLSLLRWGPRTVSELAASVGLTDNGVRGHLAVLERDGLVRQEGVRRTGGKPSYVYELTPDADALFPKGYASVLSEVLAYVRETQGREGLEEFVRGVARRAASNLPHGKDDLRSRVDAAVAALSELGGLVEVVEDDAALQIRGFSCPLSAVVRDNPETCALTEELVRTIVGKEVVECCDRTGTPRCAFKINSASK
jgi:predicted ArsR family transcriptional regulator